MVATTFPASTRGRAVQTRLAFEATGGVIPSSGWKPVRFYSLTAGLQRSLVRDNQLGLAEANGRDSTARRRGLPGGSLRRTTPINLTEAGYWLSAGFRRAAATGADGDFVHVFDTGGDGPAQLLSLAHKYAEDDFTIDRGVALAELQISAAKTENVARFNMTLMGLGDAVDDAWPAGAVSAAAAADDFSDWRWRVLFDETLVGDALNIDINLNRGVEMVQGMSGDEWPTFHHFGEADATASFKLYGRGKAFRDLGRAGASGKITLEATSPDDPDNRYLRIELPNAQFNQPQNEVSSGGQLSADFSVEAGQTSESSAAVITLANGVAAY